MGNLDGAITACLVVAALVGWAVIEGLIWIFSHVSIEWTW